MGVNRGHVHGYIAALSDRLANVRVCCGDWSRVVTRGALVHGATVGVVLDPPYTEGLRMKDLYSHEVTDTMIGDVRSWAVEHGDDPRYRIALCGYQDEHTLPDGWTVHRWTGSLGYGTTAAKADGRQNENRHEETIWFSPHCLTGATPTLFDLGGTT